MNTQLAKPRPPSARDLEIYKGFVILQHQQVSIAHMYGINQSRISQIVGKVRRWLAAGGSPSDPAIREHLAQEQLSKATKRLRLMRIIEKATYASEVRLPSQITSRHRYHGMTEVWREETRQQSPEVNIPALRLLLRAVTALDDLESRRAEAALPEKAAPLSEEQILRSVFELLCRCRSRAEAAGHVQRTADINRLIADNLSSLLGATFNTNIPPQNEPCQSANTPTDIRAAPAILVATNPDQPSTSSETLIASAENFPSKY